MIATLTAALLLATVPVDTVVRDRCDCLETNHFYSNEGEPVFSQLLFLDWCQHKGCHRCEDWRLLKKTESDPHSHITIRRDYATGEWVARWSDDSGPREVRAMTFRETWTSHDPELVDRSAHPVERRRKLWSGKEP